MIKNLTIHKVLWGLIACLALFAAGLGAFNQALYRKVISPELLPGTVAQDLSTLLVGFVLLCLSFITKEGALKKQLVSLSLLGYLFYGYGIYVIERVYNPLYLLYMAIMALSFWALVASLAQLKPDVLDRLKTSRTVRYFSAGSLLFTAGLFYFLWTAQLFPLLQTGEKLEYFYSIFILDMVFVLPALIISAFFLLKKNALGLVCTPLLFFKAFTLLFSVGLGGLLKPLYGQSANQGEIAFYIILAVLYLFLAALNFWQLDFPGPA